jgi:hypothetical protein
MKVIGNFMGNAIIVQIVAKFDINKCLCSLLLHGVFHLNHGKAIVKLVIVEDENLFFGQILSSADVIMSSLKNEL